MKHLLFPFLISAVAVSFAACATGSKSAKSDTVAKDADVDPGFLVMSDAQVAMADSNNAMAIKLFNKVAGFESQVISPLSAGYLMGILANGANGNTHDEITRAIGADKLTLDELNGFYSNMLRSGESDKSVTVSIANYIAANKDIELDKQFINTVTDKYNAGVDALDFASSSAAKKINSWCSKHTDGMIPSIIDQTQPSDKAYAMNAIYFNGSWASQFDKGMTRQERFQGYTRDVKRVMMMHQADEFLYTSNDSYSAVSLPYGNGTFAMTVILPASNSSVSDLMHGMTPKKLKDMQASMQKCTVDLKLPRFTTSTDITLNKPLSELGATSMFLPSADFTKLCRQNLFVSKVLQKAKIEVTEQGTKAAAVTAAIMVMSAMPADQPKRVTFHADRPFVYMITDNATGTIFFIGQYMGE